MSPDGSVICSRSVLQIHGLRLVSSTCSSVSAHKAAVAVMERRLVLCQQLPLNCFFLRAARRRFNIQEVNRPYRISGGCRSSSHKTEPAVNGVSGRHQTSVTCTCSVCYCRSSQQPGLYPHCCSLLVTAGALITLQHERL